MGKSQEEIHRILSDLETLYRVDLGMKVFQADNEPSQKLRLAIKQLMQDPSKANDILARINQEDPALYMELIKWIKSKQK